MSICTHEMFETFAYIDAVLDEDQAVIGYKVKLAIACIQCHGMLHFGSEKTLRLSGEGTELEAMGVMSANVMTWEEVPHA